MAVVVSFCSRRESSTVIRDDLGREVALPPRVERVVTLAPNLTELLFAIGAGRRVVATDQFSDEPEAARRLPKVGGMHPDIERIVAMRPDLVVASTSGNHPNLAPALDAARQSLYVVRTDRLTDIPRVMERLGALLKVDAARVADALRRDLESARRHRPVPPGVLFVVWPDPLYVAGRDTFADDLLMLAGARNVVKATGWPQYPLEKLVAEPPDLILYPAKSVTRPAAERLLERLPDGSRVLLQEVDENRFTRPGPRVGEAARQLNAILDAWENRAGGAKASPARSRR